MATKVIKLPLLTPTKKINKKNSIQFYIKIACTVKNHTRQRETDKQTIVHASLSAGEKATAFFRKAGGLFEKDRLLSPHA